MKNYQLIFALKLFKTSEKVVGKLLKIITQIGWSFWESCWKVAESSNSNRLKRLRSYGNVAENYNSNTLKLLRKLLKSRRKKKLKSVETFEKLRKSLLKIKTQIGWNFCESCGKVAENWNSNRLKLLRKLRKVCWKLKLKSVETFEKVAEK